MNDLEKKNADGIVCDVCFRHCLLKEGQTGFCRARRCEGGKNVCANYGRLTSLSMDPIEKKPLRRFYPGSYILSAGSYGCNLSCPFCQNHSLSMENEHTVYWREYSAKELASLALEEPDNLGLAFTYNEPMISYEYILDCARLIHPEGRKIVLVTNGCVSARVLETLIPEVDAMNIDLKGASSFYRELSGDEDMVRRCIAYCAKRTHVEVTTLIVPTKNDQPSWIRETAAWLSDVDPQITWHLTRYFPRYHYTLPATNPQTVLQLAAIAREYLPHVYTGNL